MAARGAFVTLVMRGDAYVPGAEVLGHSLRRFVLPHMAAPAELVCMVTPDVSAAAVARLARVFDAVRTVAYVSTPRRLAFRTRKQTDAYAPWIADALTKWQCLAMTEYARVVLLDADMIARPPPPGSAGLGDLFALAPPAAVFSTPWLDAYVEPKPGLRGIASPWPAYLTRTGARVAGSAALAALRRGLLAPCGAVVVLAPSDAAHARLLALAASPAFAASPGAHSGADEQALVHVFASETWTHIHQVYAFVPWHHRWLRPGENGGDLAPRAFHYFSSKPWATPRGTYPDMDPWWELRDEIDQQ